MIYFICIIVGGIAIDQITKFIASIYKPESFVFIKGFIEFDYLENRGAAFGFLEGNQLLLSIITMLALVVFGYLTYRIKFKQHVVLGIGLALVISGTLGNAIDRVTLGYVVDFLYYPWLEKMLPNIGGFSNNPADLFLFFGLILIVIHILFFDRKKKEDVKEDTSGQNNSTKNTNK